jgi:hypothetical protein
MYLAYLLTIFLAFYLVYLRWLRSGGEHCDLALPAEAEEKEEYS